MECILFRSISKDHPSSKGPKPGPSAGKSGDKVSRHGTKKPRKERPDQTGTKREKSEHSSTKRDKSQSKKDGKSHEKSSGGSKHKSKKASKKKSLNLYTYSELAIHSSEDDLYGYKDEPNLELDADMGWDPSTYYPMSHKAHNRIQSNKPIELMDLSSPAVLGCYEEEEPYCKSIIPYLHRGYLFLDYSNTCHLPSPPDTTPVLRIQKR